ncbi:hypothetical protein Tco_1296543, partial [Tanacetum coccineum]
DPYEAIRQAYLVGTDTESEPFEGEAESPESPHIVASPTSLPDSTPPTCHVEESEGSDTFGARSTSLDSTAPLLPDHPLTYTTPTLVLVLCRTACMVVRVPLMISPGFSASTAEDDEEEEDNEEGDDEEEDKEIKESLDSDSLSEGAEDEGPTTEDEDPAAGDEGLAAGNKGPGIGVKSLSLGGDEDVPKGQQRAAPVAETAMGEPLRLGYKALRRREIALGEGRMPSVFEVGQSSGSVPESERPEIVSVLRHPALTTWMDSEDAPSIVPLPISSPMISLTVPSLIALPATAETEGFLTEYDRDIGELFTRPRAVRDEIFSQRYQFRSLEHEQERVL